MLERESDVLRQANRLLREDAATGRTTSLYDDANQLLTAEDFEKSLALRIAGAFLEEALDDAAGELSTAESLFQNLQMQALLSGEICLGTGYRSEDAKMAMASALLLSAAGRPAFGEMVSHHQDGMENPRRLAFRVSCRDGATGYRHYVVESQDASQANYLDVETDRHHE